MIGYIYEDPTTTADGAAATARNRLRSSSATPNMLIFTGPTVTVDGTELTAIYMSGGSGPHAGGGGGDSGDEWVLDAGDYLVRVENISATAGSIAGVVIVWHEGTV